MIIIHFYPFSPSISELLPSAAPVPELGPQPFRPAVEIPWLHGSPRRRQRRRSLQGGFRWTKTGKNSRESLENDGKRWKLQLNHEQNLHSRCLLYFTFNLCGMTYIIWNDMYQYRWINCLAPESHMKNWQRKWKPQFFINLCLSLVLQLPCDSWTLTSEL